MSGGRAAAIAESLVGTEEAERVPLQELPRELEKEPECLRLFSVVIGTISGVKDSGVPLVDFKGNPTGRSLAARSTIAITEDQIGRDVALMFENGSPKCPIVIGLVQNIGISPTSQPHQTAAFEVDGERVVLTAEKELVLRCGDASIVLTRTGKILIRGASLLSRASGVNRIKGGSVQIN
jgi:hypothetical protein